MIQLSRKFRQNCFEYFNIIEYYIDTFTSALDHRIAYIGYKQVGLRFGFRLSASEIAENSERLLNIYKNDLDSDVKEELLQFQQFCANLLKYDPEEEDISREQAMYSLIIKKNVRESFLNVEIILRTYLTLMVSNCAGEHSFSRLKRIKNSLRTSCSQKRLNFLTIMSLNVDILRALDLDDLIKKFANKKARRHRFT